MSIASDEYQTPKKYIKAAKEVMNIIHLDPACSHSNFVRIKNYINVNYAEGGLERSWHNNIWLNEPYSKPNLSYWTNKLIKEFGEFRTKQAINLVPSYTSEQWYHRLLFNCSAICLPNHRIHHLIDGKIKDSPRFSSTFFYLGHSPIKFIEVFSQFGKCFLNS